MCEWCRYIEVGLSLFLEFAGEVEERDVPSKFSAKSHWTLVS